MAQSTPPCAGAMIGHARALADLAGDVKRLCQRGPELDADQAEGVAADLACAQDAIRAALDVLAPLWQVQFETLIPEPLAAVLDLSTWSETCGVTSTRAMICPHCGFTHDMDGMAIKGPFDCHECGRTFWVEIVPTPHGEAWSTWQSNPRRAPAEGGGV